MNTGMWCLGFVLHNNNAGMNAIRNIDKIASKDGLLFGCQKNKIINCDLLIIVRKTKYFLPIQSCQPKYDPNNRPN